MTAPLSRIIARALSLPVLLFAAGHTSAQVTAIVEGTLVTPGAPPLAHATIVIDGDRIVEAGGGDRIRIPAGARIVSAAGMWIVPGFIDAHIHLFQSGDIYTRPDIIDLRGRRSYARERGWVRQSLPDLFARYLASGITSVADVGGPFWTFAARDSAARSVLAPTIAAAGPLVATWAPTELTDVDDPPMLVPHTPEEARSIVRRILAYHPFAIKIWYIVPRGLAPRQLLPIVAAAIDESHRHGTRVAVHATELETARLAVEAGADILVHSVEDAPVDDAFIALAREHHLICSPTLLVGLRYRQIFSGRLALSPIERERGNAEVIASLDELAGLPPEELPPALGAGIAAHAPPPVDSIAAGNLLRLEHAGITIAVGTDAGNIGTLHGPSFFMEMALMAAAGLTPAEILEAATLGGARLIGREGDLGSIEPGKLADLVILSADPLADPENLTAITMVVKHGTVLRPEEIPGGARPNR